VKPPETHDQYFFSNWTLPVIVLIQHPLWRANGSVVYNCCRPSPAQSFSGPSSYFTVSDSGLPQPGGTGYMSPKNRVAQLYPQALGSLFVASYDSQGYGGDIRNRLHAGSRIGICAMNRTPSPRPEAYSATSASFKYSLQIYFYSIFYPKAGVPITIFCFQLVFAHSKETDLYRRILWKYYRSDQTWHSTVISFKRVFYCDFYKSRQLEKTGSMSAMRCQLNPLATRKQSLR
jgi:hypothetical protein